MLHETDLPCSDCGAELVYRDVEARELATLPPIDDTVRLAECPECGARYFPEQSLSKLSTRADENHIEGGR